MSLFLRRTVMAIQFFTRIPLPMGVVNWMNYSPALQAQCLRHWPGVGAVLGMLAASVLVFICKILPQTTGGIWVAVIMSTGLLMYLTGALHEDGLADFSDALGGGNDKEKMLSIMKDSRIGSFGALALFMTVFCKTALLVALLETKLTGAITGLILAHVCSRCPPLWIAYLLPYARQAEQSKNHFAAEPEPAIARSNALVGSVWLGLCLICCYPYLGLAPLLLVLLGVILPNVWLFRCLKHRLQGFTGDTLGASQQLAQALAKRRPDLCWTTTPLLNEMNFGTWEGVSWTHIPKKDLDAWILDFMFYRPGGAECLNDVFLRVHSMLKNTFDKNQKQAAWLTHAGVIKTVLWWTTNRHTPPKAHEWPKNSLGFGQWLEITKKDLLYSRV